ncbi:hypothetical protein TcWFU_009678 [Taenia crassiceps]|uniref:Secreted protein n=1 Tax=Taenia crassiceps TaxID=6207 RepID=A0ABR4Q2E9_9CEST
MLVRFLHLHVRWFNCTLASPLHLGAGSCAELVPWEGEAEADGCADGGVQSGLLECSMVQCVEVSGSSLFHSKCVVNSWRDFRLGQQSALVLCCLILLRQC